MILYVCKTECKEYPDKCSGTINEFVNVMLGYPCGKLGYNRKKRRFIMLNPEVTKL